MSLLGTGNHKYLFNETSGDSADSGSTGGKPFLRANDYGTPTLSSTGISFDGVGDALYNPDSSNPLTTVAASATIDHAHSFCMVVDPVTAISSVLFYLLGGHNASAPTHLIYWDNVNSTADRFQALANVAGGGGGCTLRTPKPAAGDKCYFGVSVSAEGHVYAFMMSEDGTTILEYRSNTNQTNGTPPGRPGNQGINVMASSTATPGTFTEGKLSYMETWTDRFLTHGEHHAIAREHFGLSAITAATPTNFSDDLPTDFTKTSGTANTIADNVNRYTEKMIDLDNGNSVWENTGLGALAASDGATWEFVMRVKTLAGATKIAIAQFDAGGGSGLCMTFAHDAGGSRMQMQVFSGSGNSITTNFVPTVQVSDLNDGDEVHCLLMGNSDAEYNATERTCKLIVNGIEMQYATSIHVEGGTYAGPPSSPDRLTLGATYTAAHSGEVGMAYFKYYNRVLNPAEQQLAYEAYTALLGTDPAYSPGPISKMATSVYRNFNDPKWNKNGSIDVDTDTPVFKESTSATFDDVDDYLDTAEKPFPDGVSKGTYCFLLSTNDSSGFIFSQRPNAISHLISSYWDSSNRVWIQVGTSSGNYIDAITDLNTIKLGRKYWLTLTFDLAAREARIYIDRGVEDYFRSDHVAGNPGTSITTTDPLWLGANQYLGPGSFVDGSIENVLVFNDIVLTETQAEDLYDEMVGLVDPVIPRATSDYVDVTDTPFTEVGSPTSGTPRFQTTTALDLDGSDDRLTTSVKPFADGVSKGTFAIVNSQGGSLGTPVSMRDNTSGAGVSMNWESDQKIVVRVQSTLSNYMFSRYAASELAADTEYVLVGAFDMPNRGVHIYADGVEETYAGHTSTSGASFSDIPTMSNLQIGADQLSGPTDYSEGHVEYFLAWDGVQFCLLEAAALQQELLALSGGGGSGLPEGGSGRDTSRSDILRQARWNRGLPRFVRR